LLEASRHKKNYPKLPKIQKRLCNAIECSTEVFHGRGVRLGTMELRGVFLKKFFENSKKFKKFMSDSVYDAPLQANRATNAPLQANYSFLGDNFFAALQSPIKK